MTGPTATPGVAQCRTCGDQISEADIRRSATPAGAKSCANVSCSVDRNGPTDPLPPVVHSRSGLWVLRWPRRLANRTFADFAASNQWHLSSRQRPTIFYLAVPEQRPRPSARNCAPLRSCACS